jgi:hypothetical protein
MENQAPDIIPELAELRKPQKVFSVPPPPELTGLSTQIGGGVPGVPTNYAAERAKYKKPEEASVQQAKLLQRQQELETDIGTATQAKEQYLAEAKVDIARQQREAVQNVEANLEAIRKKFPYSEFHPTKDNIETLSTLFGLIGVVGMAMGGSGKMSAMNSLNAMSGMMKGWQQGRADLWKKEKEEFDKNMQKTKAILEDAYRDADRAMKTLAYNVQEAEALAGQSAAKLGGQVGKQILEKQGVEKFYAFVEGVKKDLTHAEDKAQEKAKYEAELARKKSEDIERRAHQKRMEQFEQQKIDIQKTKAERPQRGAGSQETSLRVLQQDVDNAVYNLNELKADSKPGRLPGGSVAFANYFKGDIRADIIRYATNQFVETDLQSNDALMLNFAFDMASAQSGGRGQLSDAKVRSVVAQMPLDEQPEETKQKKWRALIHRVEAANATLPEDKKFKIPEEVTKYYKGSRPTTAQERQEAETIIQQERSSASGVDKVTGLPRKNSKGYTLETDGAGTYIYVSPDRKSYEKVE